MDTKKTEDVRGGLSRSESLLLSSLAEKNKTIFELADIVAELGCSYEYAKVLVNKLAGKKWVTPLKRGTYLIVPLSAGAEPKYTEHEFVIASKLVSPYYIAYWSALNFHGLTEQTPFTVFVATTKRRTNKAILGTGYKFVTLDKKKFFGFEARPIGSHKVDLSTLEKTLADALDHPEYCGGIGEVAKALWNANGKASLETLVDHASRMRNGAILKRLGFLVELLGLKADDRLVKTMRRLISKGFSKLDPTAPRKGLHLTRWNLLVNVSEKAATEWRRGF